MRHCGLSDNTLPVRETSAAKGDPHDQQQCARDEWGIKGKDERLRSSNVADKGNDTTDDMEVTNRGSKSLCPA